MTLSPGLYPGMSREAYFALDAVNQSSLLRFRHRPARARYELTRGEKDATPEMDLGTATHTAIFEPERFAREYVEVPHIDKRTKAGKVEWLAWQAANAGKQWLEEGDLDKAHAMAAGVYEHETAAELLAAPGPVEVVAVWTDEATGTLCKARLDALKSFAGETWIVDLKTTKDAEDREVARSIHQWGYAHQGAFYLDGLAAIDRARGREPRPRRFVLIFVESAPPHLTRVVEPGIVHEHGVDPIAVGRAEYRRHLATLLECRRTGLWPGYPAGIEPMELPAWATKETA